VERTMARKPATIDEYLATVSGEKRAALEKLRKTIRAIVPKAEECISYAIPAFRLDGKIVPSFRSGQTVARDARAQADQGASRRNVSEPLR